jgi:hypothetical protein
MVNFKDFSEKGGSFAYTRPHLAIVPMGICFIIDGAASGVTKRRHDITFPPLTHTFLQDFGFRGSSFMYFRQ